MNELNVRQWRLYDYLKERGDVWASQITIALDLWEYYEFDESAWFHDSAARLQMTKDIQAINSCPAIQKIVISSPNGVKLANEAEAVRFISGKFNAAYKAISMAKMLEQKAGLNGQARFTFGKEREIILAFTDSNKRGEELRKARLLSGYTQKRAVDKLSEYINIDGPMLSKIENGVFNPTKEQEAAFISVYGASYCTRRNKKEAEVHT